MTKAKVRQVIGEAVARQSAVKRMGRIMVVDDHPVVRHGLIEIINRSTDMEVIGQAGRASEAAQLIEQLRPDLVVIDISLEDGSGIELIKQIKSRHPEVRMLVNSMHDEKLYAERALRAGAMGYINKEQSMEQIVDAIRQVLKGRVYLSNAMSDRVLHRVISGGVEEEAERSPVQALSDRELEVFELMGKGLTTRQVAAKLHLSPKTVETHREHIKTKLKIVNNNQLLRHAVQWVLEGA
jgi:DNA-binding NarL/FixJ family response regulator